MARRLGLQDLMNPEQSSRPGIPTPAVLPFSSGGSPSVSYDIELNRQTTLSKLYHYALDTCLEFPESSSLDDTGPVGHMFQLDPQNWTRPVLDFVYSRGSPKGFSKKSEPVYNSLFVNPTTGDLIPLRTKHSTCT